MGVRSYQASIANPEELSFAEFQAVAGLTLNFLNVWEDRYFMYEHGLISDQAWKGFIDADIGYTLGNRFARALWETSKGVFAPELVGYVDAKLVDVSASATYESYLNTLDAIAGQKSRE